MHLSPTDAEIPAAAFLEQALLDHLDVIGFNLDRKKCFDNFDAIMTCTVMRAMGARTHD